MISILVCFWLWLAPPSVDLPKDLDLVLRNYEKAWRAKDATALAALFAEDGFALGDGAPFARGRSEIEKAYAGSGNDLYLRAVAFHQEGNLAVVIGAFTQGSAENPDRGKFVLTLRRAKAGADWKIWSDMDNGVRR
jgi:uncharacterized protein (TIGR02246 family)